MLIGAGGRTKAELEHALGVHRSRSLATKYSQIHGNLSFLRIANILALSRGFSPKDIFLDFIQRGFGTKTKEFDFINKKIESVDEINRIVKSATNGSIRNLISPSDINESLKMLLINAIYFKAKWKQSFNPEDSFSSVFKSQKSGDVMTKYMTGKMTTRLDETDDLDILELPYTDVSKSMVIFLPKTTSKTKKFIDQIFKYPIQDMKDKPTILATISIPNFKINYKMNLKPAMNQMGVSEMFSNQANFSYISNQPLTVSDAVHKAFIEVNEEGTEAAAATVSLFSFKSAGIERRFFANKPFYFMVYDFENKLPIFVGKFSNPSKSSPSKINQKKQESVRHAADCQPYVSVFGAALQNKKECSRPYAWFMNNNSACQVSERIYAEFLARQCGDEWCQYAAEKYQNWEQRYTNICQSENSKKSAECNQIKADLKTKSALACEF